MSGRLASSPYPPSPGARAFPGNPYDGHTLAEQIEQATILMQDVKGAPKPHTAIVDLGYRGVEVPGVEIIPAAGSRV